MTKQSSAVRQRGFERVVVLVDVTVVVQQDGVFASRVFESVQNILELCDEHSKHRTVWGYQLFDPSLKSLGSRSKIRKFVIGRPLPEQFDTVSNNLARFSSVLHSLVGTNRQYECNDSSRADYTRLALSEIISDFVWDPLVATDSSSDEERRKKDAVARKAFGVGARRDANTVVCISSIPSSWEELSRFLNSPQQFDESREKDLKSQLATIFYPVRKALESRNIQACFVDVPKHCEMWSEERMGTLADAKSPRGMVVEKLSELLNFVMPLDVLTLGPKGVSPCLLWNKMADPGPVVPGVTLEGKIIGKDRGNEVLCEVKLQPLNVLCSATAMKSGPIVKSKSSEGSCDFHIELESVTSKVSVASKLSPERFLVKQMCSTGASQDEDRHPVGDKLLELLPRRYQKDQKKMEPSFPGMPAWQLLLLTLASENVVCRVKLHNLLHGGHRQAIMEAFDTQSAILTVEQDCSAPCNLETSSDRQSASKMPCKNVGLKRERDLPKPHTSLDRQPSGTTSCKSLGPKSSGSKRERDLPQNPTVLKSQSGGTMSGTTVGPKTKDEKAKYPGLIIVPSRKRQKAERVISIAGDENSRAEDGQQQRVDWPEARGSTNSCTSSKIPLLSNVSNLLATYVTNAKASRALLTMNDLLMAKKRTQPASDVGFLDLLSMQHSPTIRRDHSKRVMAVKADSTTEDTSASASRSSWCFTEPGRLEQSRDSDPILHEDGNSVSEPPCLVETREDDHQPSLLHLQPTDETVLQRNISPGAQEFQKCIFAPDMGVSLGYNPTGHEDSNSVFGIRSQLGARDHDHLPSFFYQQTTEGGGREGNTSFLAQDFWADTSVRGNEQNLGGDLPLHEESDSFLGPVVQTEAQNHDPLPSIFQQEMAEDEMRRITSSAEQKIRGYLSAPVVDCHKFAAVLFREAECSLRLILGRTAKDGGSHCDDEASRSDLDKRVARKLKKLFLKSHRRLLEKYEKRQASSSPRDSNELMDEKAKDIELQILFRLEMMSWGGGRLVEHLEARHTDLDPTAEKRPATGVEDQLVKEICTSLDCIQFCWLGGIFGGKDLRSYCSSLFAGRYKDAIPSTIAKILRLMDLEEVAVRKERDLMRKKKRRAKRTVHRQGSVGKPPLDECQSHSHSQSHSQSQSQDSQRTSILKELLDDPNSRSGKRGSYHFGWESKNFVRTKKVRTGFRSEMKPMFRDVLKERDHNVGEFRILSTPLQVQGSPRSPECNDSQRREGRPLRTNLSYQFTESNVVLEDIEDLSDSWIASLV